MVISGLVGRSVRLWKIQLFVRIVAVVADVRVVGFVEGDPRYGDVFFGLLTADRKRSGQDILFELLRETQMYELLYQVDEEESEAEDQLRDVNSATEHRDLVVLFEQSERLPNLRLQMDEGGEEEDAATEAQQQRDDEVLVLFAGPYVDELPETNGEDAEEEGGYAEDTHRDHFRDNQVTSFRSRLAGGCLLHYSTGFLYRVRGFLGLMPFGHNTQG